ncbi:hypothetical protein J2T16_001872 [Paenibacillus intestini]|nr:hypothetical protein [Paenibacillus intestini]
MVIFNPVIFKEESLTLLAPMECLSSCVVSYLKHIGMNPNYFLIGYWSLRYDYGNLAAGMSASEYNLTESYGLDIVPAINSSKEELIRSLSQGHVSFYSCISSSLTYFPKVMLTHENSGFTHVILLVGYNETTDRILLADPTAKYLGEIRFEDLLAAGTSTSGFSYYMLQQNGYKSMVLNSYIKEKVSQAYMAYLYPNDHSSIHLAVKSFIDDLDASFHWTKAKRDSWIMQNNISLTSIYKMRGVFWKSYKESCELTEANVLLGDSLIEGIIRQWVSSNFMLVKYQRANDNQLLVESIKQGIKKAVDQEREFLAFLCDLS